MERLNHDPWAMFPAPLDILRLKFPVQMVAVMLDFLPCALHWVAHLTDGLVEHPNSVRFWMREVQNDFCIFYLVAGWPGLDKGTLFLVLHVWNSDTHHSLSLMVPSWKIRLRFKPRNPETLLIHFSRYSC